ncbi:MAG: GNAT family N-acetyltransferase [Actinomycetota bacterium]|nr:GNAT family N-acetyltransferase [Actinomycetota bacterium]
MSPVRRGVKGDAPKIAQRVAEQLARDARVEPLVSATFSRQEFEFALVHSTQPVWVDDSNGRFRGHLYGATFDDPLHGRQTWTGPDGYSYEVPDVLDNLCEHAYRAWREEGSSAHLVWALAGNGTQAWIERGYRIVSVRGSQKLNAVVEISWPPRHRVRPATTADLATALAFDDLIDRAQGVDPESVTDRQRAANTATIVDLLEDPECHYYFVEVDDVPIAQCTTFALPELRGNYPDTVHIGSLAVTPAFQRRGLATTLMHLVMNVALEAGYGYAEVRWHIDNEPATSLWSALGFHPTYVQLRRSLAD